MIRFFPTPVSRLGHSLGHRLTLAILILAAAGSAGAQEQPTTLPPDAPARLAELHGEVYAHLEAGTAIPAERADEALELIPVVLDGLEAKEALSDVDLRAGYDIHDLLSTLFLQEGPWLQRIRDGDELDRIRRLFLRRSSGETVLGLDSILIGGLFGIGRRDDADRCAEQSLAVLGKSPARRAFLLTLLADLRRVDERWAESAELLDQADSALSASVSATPEAIWFEARSYCHGIRGQLEQALGRPEQAFAALADEREWADRYVEAVEGTGWIDRAREVRQNSIFRTVDFWVMTAQLELVVETVDGLIEGDERVPPHLLVPYGISLAELEIMEPDRVPRAREVLEPLVSEGALTPQLRANAALCLARLDLLAGRLEAVPRWLELGEAELAAWRASSSGSDPLRDLAFGHSLRGALALATDASREELEGWLETLDEDLDAFLARWSKAPRPIGGVGLLHEVRHRSVLGAYVDLCLAIGDRERAFRRVLDVQAQMSLGRLLGASSPTLDEVRASLVERGGLLVYLPTLERTHLFVLDARGLDHLDRPGSTELLALSHRLDLLWASGEPAGETAGELGRGLLPESLHPRLEGWSHVYVVGADLLDRPAFEILPFGASTVGLELPIAFLPSIPIGVRLAGQVRGTKEAAPGTLQLFLSPPVAQRARERWPGLVELPAGAEIVERLTRAFPGERCRCTVGPEATRAALLAIRGGNARILHLFCHGVNDPSRALTAGLALAPCSPEDDGLVWSADLAPEEDGAARGKGVDAPELVVLAACGAARGPTRRGENGIAHLGGAFLRAGAAAVLLSRSDLEVESTLRTMELFHVQLAEGEPPAEALRAARAEFVREGGRADLVAPLLLLGASHQPMFVPSGKSDASGRGLLPLALVAGIALVTLVWILQRRRTRA